MGSPYQFLFKKVKHQSKALSGSLFYATDEKDKGHGGGGGGGGGVGVFFLRVGL